MFIALEESCNKEKLKKVMKAAAYEIGKYFGLTASDKEDIMMMVIYRFEADEGRFPISVYTRHAKNKVVDLIELRTRKKRCVQKVVDGRVVYMEDWSLNQIVGEDGDMELGDFIPAKEMDMHMVELMADWERVCPELIPLLQKALDGERLTREEKAKIKKKIKREDLVE